LIGVMLFSFARVSAVLGMKVSDFYENGRRRWFRLLEKGGKHHEVPVHHKAQDYVAEYLEKAGFELNKPLFQTFHQKQPDVLQLCSRAEARVDDRHFSSSPRTDRE
jgi:integrase